MKSLRVSRRNVYMVAIVIFTFVLLTMASCTSAKSSTTTAVPTSTVSSSSTTGITNTISTATKSALGNYLVDGKGITLYWATLDSVGQSNVSGSSLSIWPVFYTSNVTIPSTLNPSDFGSITRADGKNQTTYKGWPLYYYYQDISSGDTLGEGVDGVWFIVNPTASNPTAANPVTTTPATATTTTTTIIPGY